MEVVADRCPELWLIGKSGAGKSALMQLAADQPPLGGARTRAPRRQGGPGPRPAYVLVDTPGFGASDTAPGPFPSEMDALVIVHRLDDMVTAPLTEALRPVLARRPKLPLRLVLTGADLAGAEAARARAHLSAEIGAACGRSLSPLVLALVPGQSAQPLLDMLSALAAEARAVQTARRLSEEERAAFARLRPLVLRHATAAGLSDAAPLIGAVAVPAVQARMLGELARSHGLTWTARRAALFAGALGAGALANFGAGYAVRQGAKLVPVVGPVVGGAAAMSMGFAATYALGRAAAAWLFHQAQGTNADPQELRTLYTQSHRDGPDAV